MGIGRFGFPVAVIVVSALSRVDVAMAGPDEGLVLELEGGPVWQTRNDVRIPSETGTAFSLVDAIGSGPYRTVRFEVAFDLNERHGVRAVIAPLDVEEAGALAKTVLFAGETFPPATPTDASYKFSSYRFTYRYRFYDGATWRWRIGFTGFIRDARIALRQNDKFAEDTDVGFVPLAHLRGDARLSERWRFIVDFDGVAAPQGRAFDVAAKLGYRIAERWELAFGYRTIEGGADVEKVYTFAWLHFAVGSVRFRF